MLFRSVILSDKYTIKDNHFCKIQDYKSIVIYYIHPYNIIYISVHILTALYIMSNKKFHALY